MRRAPRLLVLAITLAAAVARAHVAPSVDDNNRYIKVSPAADRVRVAYTVFFGEVPGAQTRPSLDANHDGTLSDEEGQAFGVKLAGQVGSSLELTIDGTIQPVAWTTVAVGLGSPQVAAGSFSVDMVAWACLPRVRGRHTLGLRDRFRVPHPGETEIKVEDGPGITVESARIGRQSDPANDFRFAGPGGPLMDDGLDLAFVAADSAPLTNDGTCTGATAKKPIPKALVIALAAGLAAVLALVVVWIQRKKRAA
jgi:hypothetical protein